MSKLLVLFIVTLLVSCSSLSEKNINEISSPGYQFGRQWDERALRSGVFER